MFFWADWLGQDDPSGLNTVDIELNSFWKLCCSVIWIGFQQSSTNPPKIWNHRMPQLEGTDARQFVPNFSVYSWENKRNVTVLSSVSKTLNHLPREEQLLFIPSVCAEHLRWVNHYATYWKHMMTKTDMPLPRGFWGATQDTYISLLTLQALFTCVVGFSPMCLRPI